MAKRAATAAADTAATIERGRRKVSQALVRLTCEHVFHASIIMRLQRVEDTQCPFPMGTDGVHLLVNPAICAEFSVAEITAVLAHEAMHVAGRHPLRREQRDPLAWNLACDKVVNRICGEGSFTLPSGCVPAADEDRTPEFYYEQIAPQVEKLRQQAREDAEKLADVIERAFGRRVDDLDGPRNADGSTMNEVERQQLDQETRQWVEAAATAAKRAGPLPAGLDRFVTESLRSVQPWREILARFVSEKRLTDFSWKRPNKRYTGYGLYLPILEARDVPRVACALDTSGSIDPRTMECIVAEVIAVLDLMTGGDAVEVPVLWFDAGVYPQIVTDASELRPKGGGGTDYAPVMAWVRKHHGAHDLGLVVVTDGECASFGEAPPCDVLWVLTRENGGFQPPFGELALVLDA